MDRQTVWRIMNSYMNIPMHYRNHCSLSIVAGEIYLFCLKGETGGNMYLDGKFWLFPGLLFFFFLIRTNGKNCRQVSKD